MPNLSSIAKTACAGSDLMPRLVSLTGSGLVRRANRRSAKRLNSASRTADSRSRRRAANTG